MSYKKIISFLFLLLSIMTNAQTISATVIDKKSNEPIPYATVQFSENQGIITNKEGQFSITLEDSISETDSIHISSMGYEKIGLSIQSPIDSKIYLVPKAIELGSAFVSNKNLTADEVIDNVKEKIAQNYDFKLSQKRLFFRESEFNTIQKLDVDFKKSTIKELDKKLIDSMVSTIPKKSAYYTEILGNYSGDLEKRKLHINKAAELYDKNNFVSMNALSDHIETILKKSVKPDSYLKIKSGWFGTKVQVDSILDTSEDTSAVKDQIDEQKNKENKSDFQKYRKNKLHSILSSLFYNEDVKSNFLNKSGRYTFEHKEYTSIDDQSVYIITFSPKRSGDFKGTLYVNTEDFAIMRMDYENVKPLKKFKLLGVQYQDNIYRNKLIFNKGKNNKYHLKYLEMNRGNFFGFDRPLKIIEKNKHAKGKRKQNELSLEINTIITNKSTYEIVVFDSKTLTETDYKNSEENNTIKPEYLSKYTPEFWKGHNIIEPNMAIRQFTVVPEAE